MEPNQETAPDFAPAPADPPAPNGPQANGCTPDPAPNGSPADGSRQPSAPRRPRPRRALGVQGQLTLFICGITLVSLGLIWLLITYGLQPQYNRTIRAVLQSRAQAVTRVIDEADGPVSSRAFGTLWLDNDFWTALHDRITSGDLDLGSCCVDISDATCRNVQYYEGLYPCVLHETMSAFDGEFTFTRDTRTAMRLRRALFEQGEIYEIVDTGATRQMVVGCLTADGSYGVLVSANLAQIETAAAVLRAILPPIGLLLLLVDLLAAVVFSRWYTRPLHQLARSAHQIADGSYDVHLDVRRRDEFGLVAEEFNHMAAEVKHAMQLGRDILANVSHDLRTPLTLIKGYAETVRDINGDNAEKRTEQCSIIVDETDRLSALVNSVMELSKVSSGAEKPELVEFDMSELCFEVAGLYDAVCDRNGWTLRLEADRRCPVSADPAMMERVLHNLLGNATHHIGPDGVFVLRALPLPAGGCRVEVEDHGPGIPPEELPYLFDRYYRARKDAGKPGTGLGLSITKAILQQHGFAFGVNSAVGRGSTFWFEMKGPADPDPKSGPSAPRI